MMFAKSLIKTVSISALFLTSSAYAENQNFKFEKPNFSYSSIGFSVAKITLASPICISTSCTSSATGKSIGGTLQVADNIVLSATHFKEELSASSWNGDATSDEIGVGVVTAISNKIDLAAGVFSANVDISGCSGSYCSKLTSDTQTSLRGGLITWLNDTHTFSATTSFETSKLSKESDRTNSLIFGLSTYIEKHHEINFSFATNKDADGTSISYSYLF